MRRSATSAARIGAELVPVLLVLGCLGGALALVIEVHRRQAAGARRPEAAAAVAVAVAEPSPEPIPEPPSEPVQEPAAPAPVPAEDPTPRVVAEIRGHAADERAAAREADLRASEREEARGRVEAEIEAYGERERLVARQAEEMDALAARLEAEADALAARRDVLARRRDEARADLARAVARSRDSYAILPYRGAHGTWQRPVAIECRADRATIRPDGPSFTLFDMEAAVSRSNPVVAAVSRVLARADREVTPDGAASVPYILFVIRPDGVEAYYAARTCLERLGLSFGYELVDADVPIEYPDLSDPSQWPGGEALARREAAGTGAGPGAAGGAGEPPAWGAGADASSPYVWQNRPSPGRGDGGESGPLALGGGSADRPGAVPGDPARPRPLDLDPPGGTEPDGIGLGSVGPRVGLAARPGTGAAGGRNSLAGGHPRGVVGADGGLGVGRPTPDPASVAGGEGLGILPPLEDEPTGPGGAPGFQGPGSGGVAGRGNPSESGRDAQGGSVAGTGFGASSGGGGEGEPAATAGDGGGEDGGMGSRWNPDGGPGEIGRPGVLAARPGALGGPANGDDGGPGPEARGMPRGGAGTGGLAEADSVAQGQHQVGGSDEGRRGGASGSGGGGGRSPSILDGSGFAAELGRVGGEGSGKAADGSLASRAGGGPGGMAGVGRGTAREAGESAGLGAGLGLGLGSATPGGAAATAPSLSFGGTPGPSADPADEAGPPGGRSLAITVACGPGGVLIQPGGYRLSRKAIESEGLLVPRLRAIAAAEQGRGGPGPVRPVVVFLVEPGGEATFWAARRQTTFAGLDWPAALRLAEQGPPSPFAALRRYR
jgi:hypothetical protein